MGGGEGAGFCFVRGGERHFKKILWNHQEEMARERRSDWPANANAGPRWIADYFGGSEE